MSTVEGGWLALLRATYGDTLVLNAFAETPLAALGEQWGFGLYVVRAALDLQLHGEDLASMFHAAALGRRFVEAKGMDDSCTCKYLYEGNVRNPHIKMLSVPAGSTFVHSFYAKCNADPEHHLHQIVGSRYDKAMNQAIPWHSDQSDLLSRNTDIVSVSLGCAGLFCYMPNEKAQHSDFHKSLKLGRHWHERRRAAIGSGLRGCVPLFAGDVLLMCGSFQECMQHKTLPVRPSGGESSVDLLVRAINEK